MNFFLKNTEQGTKTVIDADIQLSGAIAQFGRIGIIKETANIIIGKFTENLESSLSSENNEIKVQENENINKDITISDLVKGFFKWLYSLLPFR